MSNSRDNQQECVKWPFILLIFLGLSLVVYTLLIEVKDWTTLKVLHVILLMSFISIAVVGAAFLYLLNKSNIQSNLKQNEFKHLEEMAKKFNERELAKRA